MDKNPWKTIDKKTVYENAWISVSHRDVLTPNGNPGIYGVVEFKNQAVGVIPVDAQGNTWLVGQYRYTLECYSWEIPEGGCPRGEEPLDAARRELKEETGMSATNWTELLRIHTTNSVSDEEGCVFIATGLTFGESQPEDTEQLKVRKLPLLEAINMVMDGAITDSISMVALLKINELINRKQWHWSES